MSDSASRYSTFTIVTPNWNGRDFLEPCIESVLGQDYPRLEYIIADGQSTDGSVQVIGRYRSALARFICEPDKGHADALNKGFAASSGEIMGWINSDDILHPGTLHFVNRLFQARPDIAWITGRPTSMGEDGRIGWIGPARPWSRLRFLAGDCEWIQQESTFWRRSLWDRAGGQLDTRYRLANDFELWTRFFRHAELHTVDRPLGCFRIRTGQRSVVYRSAYEAEADAVLQAELDGLEPEFRTAFADLIPDRARRLSPADSAALEDRLAVCDPPTIHARTARQAAAQAPAAEPCTPLSHPALARAGAADPIDTLTGSLADQRVFIWPQADTPPPFRVQALLRGEAVICAPGAYIAASPVFSPACICAIGDEGLSARGTALAAQLAIRPAATTLLPVWAPASDGGQVATRAIVRPRPGHLYVEPADIMSDAARPDGACAGQIMARLAAFLGSSDVVIIGAPTGYGSKRAGWEALAQTLAEQGVQLRIARLADDAVPDGPLEQVDFDALFEPQTRTRRLQAAPKTAPAWLAALGKRAGTLNAGMPGRVRSLTGLLWRNRLFWAGAMGVALAGLAVLAAVPDTAVRLIILATVGIALVGAGLVALAVKVRRLFFHLQKELSGLKEREVVLEMKLLAMEIRLDDHPHSPDAMDKGDDTL